MQWNVESLPDRPKLLQARKVPGFSAQALKCQESSWSIVCILMVILLYLYAVQNNKHALITLMPQNQWHLFIDEVVLVVFSAFAGGCSICATSTSKKIIMADSSLKINDVTILETLKYKELQMLDKHSAPWQESHHRQEGGLAWWRHLHTVSKNEWISILAP